MSTISLRLPELLYERVKQLSKVERVSINQIITLALDVEPEDHDKL